MLEQSYLFASYTQYRDVTTINIIDAESELQVNVTIKIKKKIIIIV